MKTEISQLQAKTPTGHELSSRRSELVGGRRVGRHCRRVPFRSAKESRELRLDESDTRAPGRSIDGDVECGALQARRFGSPCSSLDVSLRRAPRLRMKSAPRKFELTADILLRAYSIGVFPMAESREAKEVFWVEPNERGILPLDGLIVSRSLAKTVRSDRFRVVADNAFEIVLCACGGREKTWINDEIVRLYLDLFAAGHAHSVEVYQGEALVGGLYGVSLGGVFFGESMFHRVRDASKVALVHLFARLRVGSFRLLDAQFLTEHLASLGAVGISREAFRRRLAAALKIEADFGAWPVAAPMRGAEALALARSGGTEVAVTD